MKGRLEKLNGFVHLKVWKTLLDLLSVNYTLSNPKQAIFLDLNISMRYKSSTSCLHHYHQFGHQTTRCLNNEVRRMELNEWWQYQT